MRTRPFGSSRQGATQRRLGLTLIALLALMLVPAPTALAGSDDFEFGQALARKGQETGEKVWFDYARRVYDGVLADNNRSTGDRNEALYGLAMLKRSEALASAANSKVPYADVKALFMDAINGIEKFVKENADHPSIVEAKLNAGETRLNFVQWGRDLLEDIDALAARNADQQQVQDDARSMIESALAYFDALDDGWQEMDATPISQIARFHWVTCKYFAALIHPDCSTQAKEALIDAGVQLEDFISFFDGQLVAIFAQDFYGLSNWELARCAESEDEKVSYYRQAVDWFDTCIQTENTNKDTLRIIARGYLHIAQCCLDAGRIGGENFLKRGRSYLSKMVANVPPILRAADGIKAMIEWGKIEFELDNSDKAIEVLTEAKKKAEETGRIWLVNRANREITKILQGGSTGDAGGSVGADVLKSVADDQFVAKNYESAIGAYQKVITAAGDSTEDLMNFVVPSWVRISECYAKMGDLLSAALSTEPVHAAWLDGRIPRKKGDKNDKNLIDMGNLRLRAQRWFKELFDSTGSAIYRRQWTQNRDAFTRDYPGHPSGEALDYRVALGKYNEAKAQKKKRSPAWKSTLGDAINGFMKVAKDEKSAAQELAWIMLVRCEDVAEDWRGMVERADEAFAYWDSPAAQKQAKTHETVATRVAKARGTMKYWKASALVELKRWPEVIKLLDQYEIKHGDQDEIYISGALGFIIQAHLGKGEIDEATTYHKKLLRQDPDYFLLPKITFELAKYYQDRYLAIEELYKADFVKLYGTKDDRAKGAKYRWRQAQEEENFIAERLVDLNGERNKAEDLITFWEEQVIKEKKETRLTETDYTKAKWRLEGSDEWSNTDREFGRDVYKIGLLKTIANLNVKLKELTAAKDKEWDEVVRLEKALEEHRANMYPFLKKAANHYFEWDQVVKATDEKTGRSTRAAKNVSTFAYRFYYATVLNPADEDSWNKARILYEDYMGMDGVDAEEKAGAAAKLGKIYSHLSDVSKSVEDRKKFSLKALELLQEALAKVPENNAIVVRQLAGELVVIPWTGKLHQGQQFRFPITRVQDVAGLRATVKQMGTDALPMPVFKEQRKQRQFNDELNQFKKHIAAMSDQEAGRVVRNFKNAGFDPSFYREHANSRPEFRLALARVYADSGRMEDVRKAINLCFSLTNAALRVKEDTADWWESQVIKLRAYLKGAEIGRASGQGNVKAEAKEMVELAGKSIRGLWSNDHSLGEELRPETPGEIKELLARLNALARGMGVAEIDLRIDTTNTPADGDDK
ncbi:MAG: hypothetical protein QNJ98_13960 [Planctomycetota bacterium]|nr:hypothetical protein [Planctomycetota bacterium]